MRNPAFFFVSVSLTVRKYYLLGPIYLVNRAGHAPGDWFSLHNEPSHRFQTSARVWNVAPEHHLV